MAGVGTTIKGLKDIYYAKLLTDDAPDGGTAGSATYGTPKKLGHAISVEINPDVESSTLYGDNMAVATETKVRSYGINIGTTDIPLEDRAIMLGHAYDSVTGAVTVKGDDKPPYLAVMFEATSAAGNSQYYKFYKVKFAPSQQSMETEGENTNWQTPTLDGTAIARSADGQVYNMVDSSNASAASLVSNWFTSV